MAAQVEEVVLGADPLEAEHLGEQGAQGLSTGPVGRARRPPAGAASGSGSARRSSLPLTVSGSRSSTTIGRRDHVVGQRGPQVVADRGHQVAGAPRGGRVVGQLAQGAGRRRIGVDQPGPNTVGGRVGDEHRVEHGGGGAGDDRRPVPVGGGQRDQVRRARRRRGWPAPRPPRRHRRAASRASAASSPEMRASGTPARCTTSPAAPGPASASRRGQVVERGHVRPPPERRDRRPPGGPPAPSRWTTTS